MSLPVRHAAGDLARRYAAPIRRPSYSRGRTTRNSSRSTAITSANVAIVFVFTGFSVSIVEWHGLGA